MSSQKVLDHAPSITFMCPSSELTWVSTQGLSAAMISWVQGCVDLDLFTTQFSVKVLLDTWNLIKCE